MASDGPGCEIAKTELGCLRSKSVPAHFLMCRGHWFQVSHGNRQRVYATLDAEGPLGEGYRAAVQDAVADVLERNGVPRAGS
jgi:hypothetical protein